MCLCCITKKKSKKKISCKHQESGAAWHPQCTVTTDAQICNKWELIKRAKCIRENSDIIFSSEVTALSLHESNTEKNVTDRYTQPQLPALSCFRCIIHLCANLEEPSQSHSQPQKKQREREREGECRQKRNRKNRREGGGKHQNKRTRETHTEKWESVAWPQRKETSKRDFKRSGETSPYMF